MIAFSAGLKYLLKIRPHFEQVCLPKILLINRFLINI